MTPKEMALLLVRALDSKKGQDILLLETDGLTTLSDYFVLCTGTSAPQLKALADAAERSMKENDILPHHVEGHRGGTWILQDYGDVVLHLFSPEAREFYDLDRLWQDAKKVDISDVLTGGKQWIPQQ
ncbi:MAG: ribosome silencing factor [Ruminiclostridium sp.]|jgi:ribosome-associated protein|nr:ribosome silencing factor [Ruminiclostridium sp.]MCI9465836.1 ribosome silencing factor [Ruminiclostridium sp.]